MIAQLCPAEFVSVASVVALMLGGACSGGTNAARAGAPEIEALRPASGTAVADPLPSWRAGPAKRAVTDFVARVTTAGGSDFVPIEDRIAVFDNDGTLWSEQPVYTQVAFALDRLKELAPKHPEWREKQPFRGVLDDDAKIVAESGERGLMALMAATQTGTTTDEFAGIVTSWIGSARHPRFNRQYTELVYQPMHELLAYLRTNYFTVFIVSGGGVEFMRPWVREVHGVPPEHVIGSRAKLKYTYKNGKPVLERLPEVDLVDDKAGKPVSIQQMIGRRPIAAFGNSDGDFEMLEWTTSAPGPRFGLIVHHTDAEREWAYDRESHVGRLARALDEAPRRGWVVADMKRDWAVVYPFQQ